MYAVRQVMTPLKNDTIAFMKFLIVFPLQSLSLRLGINLKSSSGEMYNLRFLPDDYLPNPARKLLNAFADTN